MSPDLHTAVTLTRFGYYELKEKPGAEELNRYYSEKYYQDSKGTYAKEYSAQELRYVDNKTAQKELVLSRLLPGGQRPRTMLDIGAGEAWAIRYFKSKGWTCLGVDYSDAGCRQHNPDCLPDLVVGDIPTIIDRFITEGRTFDVLWLDNVLEHLIDPLASLTKFSQLVGDKGILVIEVPNDFSLVQENVFSLGLVSRPFWILRPDHISYFNRKGLVALCDEAGWSERFVMSDYPIDLNLFNPATNYVENKAVGRDCHVARMAIENLLHDASPEKAVELFRQLSDLGLGRQIIGFFGKR